MGLITFDVQDTTMIGKTVASHRVRGKLHELFGHDRWYISGSFANPQIKYHRDIDVYFYSKEDYKAAEQNLRPNREVWYTTKTKFATTLSLNGYDKPIQMIHKQFGPPEEIFEAMDLNVCRHAVLSNGKKVQARGACLPVYLCNVNAESFTRLLKYHRYYKVTPFDTAVTMRKIIDKYILDETLAEGYYDDETIAVNQALYRSFIKALHTYIRTSRHQKEVFTPVYDYLMDQVNEHIPEMLL